MSPPGDIASWLQRIHGRATAGYALALHFGVHAPLYLFQTFPASWNAVYADEGLVLLDPVVAWGLARTGRVTWAELAPTDRAGVLARAADHGLRHGLAVAVLRGGSRSIASLARGDRPFTPGEEEEVEAAITALHDATRSDARLSPGQREVLRRLSVAFSRA
jgi:LuxR family transcriptional regulator